MKNLSFLFITVFLIFSSNAFSTPCDTLVFQNGTEVLIEEVQIKKEVIVYKKCGETEKSYRIRKEEFLKIKYFLDSTEHITPLSLKSRDTFLLNLKLVDETVFKKSILFELRDSSILLYGGKALGKQTIAIQDIQNLQIFRKNKAVNSTFIGAAIGGTSGLLIGLRLKNFSTPFAKKSTTNRGIVLLYSGTGLLTGGLIGYLIGSAKFNIPINGQQKNYEKVKKRFIYP